MCFPFQTKGILHGRAHHYDNGRVRPRIARLSRINKVINTYTTHCYTPHVDRTIWRCDMVAREDAKYHALYGVKTSFWEGRKGICMEGVAMYLDAHHQFHTWYMTYVHPPDTNNCSSLQFARSKQPAASFAAPVQLVPALCSAQVHLAY